jgi:hypothetical protein
VAKVRNSSKLWASGGWTNIFDIVSLSSGYFLKDINALWYLHGSLN